VGRKKRGIRTSQNQREANGGNLRKKEMILKRFVLTGKGGGDHANRINAKRDRTIRKEMKANRRFKLSDLGECPV